MEKMGSPFLEESQDLSVLDIQDIIDAWVDNTVRRVQSMGEDQYKTFVEEHLEKPTERITDTVPQNKLPLLSHPPVTAQSRQQTQLAALKSDCNLLFRLYVSCQTYDGDLDQFFTHENQATPPSLSLGGKMRLDNEAGLPHCIESVLTNSPAASVVEML